MNRYIFFICFFFSLQGAAQKAEFNDNSVSYLGKTYRVGDIVNLGYGSANNKDFSFVHYGKVVGGVTIPGLYHRAKVNWSKADVEIERIDKKSNVVWLRCKPLETGTSVGSLLASKIFINLEGAVDNNEIKGVSGNAEKTLTNMGNAGATTPPAPDNRHLAPAPLAESKKGNEVKGTPAKFKAVQEAQHKTNAVNTDTKTVATNTNGKLYFRTFMWSGSYGSSLEMSWFFFGNNGMLVRNPVNGVNPINFAAELENNKDNVGNYKLAGKKMIINWQNGKSTEWSIETKGSELTAIDGGVVSSPDPMPANYRLSGQYAASAVLPNVSSVHTLVFSKDGTFTLNKQGTINTENVSALSKLDSKGTYKISGNTLWLNFENGVKQVAVIYIWDEGEGKKLLIINTSSYPQEL